MGSLLDEYDKAIETALSLRAEAAALLVSTQWQWASTQDEVEYRKKAEGGNHFAVIRSFAESLYDEAMRVDTEVKKRVLEFVGEQNPYEEAFTPLRHRLIEKLSGIKFSVSGSVPTEVMRALRENTK